ncbi:hypothetical protein [Conexibacter arvalis]|uniref:Uncharacterized protein n=1 Tax=Conexibacter arvalis TaxID=912552 RepID=A0A840IGD4_9ACTN|nr:hypothetical protein [Conexibacter arvalis]MBB4663859.1 hypothetical protein [Conexibacter arvalis]
MPAATADDLVAIGTRLIDEVFQSWQAAQLLCHEAFHAWCDAAPAQRAGAHAAYRAALDREEAAAHDLQRVTQAARLSCDPVSRVRPLF